MSPSQELRLEALDRAFALVKAQQPQMHLNAQADETLRLARRFEEYLKGKESDA